MLRNLVLPAEAHWLTGLSRRQISRTLAFLCVFLALCSLPSLAAAPATVSFSLDFPNSDPERYQITVAADGHASYECSARISLESDDRDAYRSEFTVTPATSAHIFDLAAQAQYFSGKIDSGNRKLAYTGAKKLTYKDGDRESTAGYNFSPIPAVQRLTVLFQSMAATLEFGRRLAHEHRYQKLALDEELKQMEAQIHAGDLAEVQAVNPILQQIYEDQTVINVVRARAQRIMEMAHDGAGRR
jgi:hypothetical protein